MKTKRNFIVLAGTTAFIVCLAAVVLLERREPPDESVRDRNMITVRNMTKQVMAFTIKPSNSPNAPEKKRIKPGAIDRFPAKSSLVLTYQWLGIEKPVTLISGTPYCFRYDEQNLPHLYVGSHMRENVEDLAPYVATPPEVVAKMLEMAGVNSNDVVYDLGCGDGRIVISAAKNVGARGVGVDFDPERIKEAKARARRAGVDDLLVFRIEDAVKTDFSGATVLALYLLPESLELLRPRLDDLLRPGARVVCHDYPVPGWEDKQAGSATLYDSSGNKHTIFFFRR